MEDRIIIMRVATIKDCIFMALSGDDKMEVGMFISVQPAEEAKK